MGRSHSFFCGPGANVEGEELRVRRQEPLKSVSSPNLREISREVATGAENIAGESGEPLVPHVSHSARKASFKKKQYSNPTQCRSV